MRVMEAKEALGMPLWERLMVVRQRGLEPVHSEYCVIWDDPEEPDSAARVSAVCPNWLATALHGHIRPPIEDVLNSDFHSRVLPPLSEPEALELFVKTMLPKRIWDRPEGNRRHFVICLRDMVPKDRTYRNAWRLAA